MKKMMRVKLVHSPCGRLPVQGATVKGLGLTHLYSERTIEDSPNTRGMVKKISHLVEIIEERSTTKTEA